MSDIPPSESGRPSGAFPFQPRQSGESGRFPFAPRQSSPAVPAPPPSAPPEGAAPSPPPLAPPPPPAEPKRAMPPPLPPGGGFSPDLPPPPAATAPTFAAPAPYRAPAPPPAAVVEEEAVDPSDKRKSALMVAALMAILVLGGGIAGFSAVRAFKKTGGNKKGLLHAAAYAQTRQRLMLVGMSTMQYYEKYGAWPTVGADLLEFGVDPGVLQDKFGNRFVYNGSLITCMGEDGKLGTEDDMWYDAAGFEVGGYTGEQALENVGMLPPEVRTAMQQARMASERAGAQRRQIEDMVNSMEQDTMLVLPEDGSMPTDSSSSYSTPLEYQQDSNLDSGRESDE